MKIITEKNLLDAITVAQNGGTAMHGYDQSSWCGTACCVLGHARLLAGSDLPDCGPRDGEIEDTPAGRTYARLVTCASSDILRVMQGVRPNGQISLRDAELRDADLSVADLRGADLRGADLSGAKLYRADLRDADLSDADLRDADLRRADLRDADLRGAYLGDADLRGADLSGAIFEGSD